MFVASDFSVNVMRELGDLLREVAGQRGQLRVLLQEFLHLHGLAGERFVAAFGRERQCFPMTRVSIGECFIPVGLTSLGEQNQRRRVGRLQAKREV